MEKGKTKVKEFIKIAAICALSIGAFSAAFTGFNNLAFTAATGGNVPLPITQEQDSEPFEMQSTTYVVQAELPTQADPAVEEVGEFVATTLTVIGVTDHNFHTIPISAMPMETAAQIGAEYIWDVFGVSIDGMYVTMFYSAWQGHAREHWHGQVFLTRADAMSTERFNPVFWFAIDSETGKRIDISYSSQTSNQPHDDDAIRVWRMSDELIALHEMGDAEIMHYFGMSQEELEQYERRALRYAKRHFNESTVADIALGTTVIGANGEAISLPGVRLGPWIDENGELTTLIMGFTFAVTDDTGREAEIMINTENSMFGGTVHIFTQQNDRIPGFIYLGGGRG